MSTLPLLSQLPCVRFSRPLLLNYSKSAADSNPFPSATPLLATLASYSQPAESTTTLSPCPATLASPVKHKSFVCHSYKKHRGVGCDVPSLSRRSSFGTSATRRNARNSSPLIRLLHNLRTPGVGAYSSSEVKLLPSPSGTSPSPIAAQILPSPFHFQHSTFNLAHQSPVTSHESSATSHEPAHL